MKLKIRYENKYQILEVNSEEMWVSLSLEGDENLTQEEKEAMIQVAKDSNMAIDATCGRKTKCILIMDSGHIVLSALLPDTIENRVNENQNREEQSQ